MKWTGEYGRYSWYRVVSAFWLIVIGLQWIDYTEPLWFMQTTSIVTVTLFIVGILEMRSMSSFWRWTLKTVLIMIGWRLVLTYYEIYQPVGRFFPDQIRDMAREFTPYIWFSLGAWALFEIAMRLLHQRKWLLLFLGANLVAFAALDSFTPYYLWQNVAWIVFAGLGWLVSLHFREFQLKYPQGWRRLRSEPLKIALNILIIFACVLLIGINMPAVSPVLTDPYTAWKARGGQGGVSVPTIVAEGGEVKVAARGEVISGYSRDDAELGEGFDFSYAPVMSVDSSVRSYWRGETRRIYSGKGWAKLEEEGRDYFDVRGGSTGDLPASETAPKTETMQVIQTITMQNEEVYPVLFGGYAMNSVEILDDELRVGARMQWTSKEAELHWLGWEQALTSSIQLPAKQIYPKKYAVVADIPIIPLEEVREASYEELYPGNQDSEYLQIPEEFPDRVRALAKEVTAEGTTPYAKMELLQSYLRQNYEYTNKPDLSRKESKDFVDSFLFEIKQGYCDYFSTSMVMMARSLGIPARWVKGYAPGTQPNPEFMSRFPETGMAYQVNNADAHSWAELYFGDYGWIPFEATPGFDAPIMYEQDGSVVTLADLPETDGETGGESAGVLDHINPETARNLVVIASAVLLAWVVYQLRSVLYYGFHRWRFGRPLTPGDKAVLETHRVVRRLRRRGFERSEDETLREAFQRWKDKDPELTSPLDDLLREFERASYSTQSLSQNQWKIVRSISRKLMQMTRRKWRVPMTKRF